MEDVVGSCLLVVFSPPPPPFLSAGVRSGKATVEAGVASLLGRLSLPLRYVEVYISIHIYAYIEVRVGVRRLSVLLELDL